MNMGNGHGLCTRTMYTDYGHGLWTRTMDTDYGHGLWTRTMDTDSDADTNNDCYQISSSFLAPCQQLILYNYTGSLHATRLLMWLI